jgi:hypothetical protein
MIPPSSWIKRFGRRSPSSSIGTQRAAERQSHEQHDDGVEDDHLEDHAQKRSGMMSRYLRYAGHRGCQDHPRISHVPSVEARSKGSVRNGRSDLRDSFRWLGGDLRTIVAREVIQPRLVE